MPTPSTPLPSWQDDEIRYRMSIVRCTPPGPIRNQPYACAAIALLQIFRQASWTEILLRHLPVDRDPRQEQFYRLSTEFELGNDVAQELWELGQALFHHPADNQEGYFDIGDFFLEWLAEVYGEDSEGIVSLREALNPPSRHVARCANGHEIELDIEEPGDFFIPLNAAHYAATTGTPAADIIGLEEIWRHAYAASRHDRCAKCPASEDQFRYDTEFDPARETLLLHVHHYLQNEEGLVYKPTRVSVPPLIRASTVGSGTLHLGCHAVVQYRGSGEAKDGHYRALVRMQDGQWCAVDGESIEVLGSVLEPWKDSVYGAWVVVLAMYHRISEDEFFERLGDVKV